MEVAIFSSMKFAASKFVNTQSSQYIFEDIQFPRAHAMYIPNANFMDLC